MYKNDIDMILLVGPTGSGKTLFSKEYARKSGKTISYESDIENISTEADIIAFEVYSTDSLLDIIKMIDKLKIKTRFNDKYILADTVIVESCLPDIFKSKDNYVDAFLKRVTSVVEFGPMVDETVQYTVKTVDEFMEQ